MLDLEIDQLAVAQIFRFDLEPIRE